jgi:hypothetical protein
LGEVLDSVAMALGMQASLQTKRPSSSWNAND